MEPSSQPDTRQRLTAGIASSYRDAMDVTPGWVEVCVGREVVTAFLRECGCEAEQALWPKAEGPRLLQEYHSACACELFPSLRTLVRDVLAADLRHVWLLALPNTKDKLLVLIVGDGSESRGGNT